MKVLNKFDLGDVVYYPAADLRESKVIKSEITGILYTVLDGKEEIIYQTGMSYGVAAEDVFKTARSAKKRLIKILQEKKKSIDKDINETIKKVEATKPKDLVDSLLMEDYEEKQTEETNNNK